MVNKLSISLIIPCYNEELNIQKGVLDKIGNFTKTDDRFKEVIVVDDGSTDFSKKIIRERYLKEYPKFILKENQHQGKAWAIMRGIKEASGNFVFFSDIDLATPIEESNKLIREAVNGYKIIIGSRNTRREGAPFLRKVMSKGAVIVKNFFLGLQGIKDTQCGFKMFERKSALSIMNRLKVFHEKKLNIKDSSVSAGFDLEFLFVASKMGLKIREIPVEWRHVETKNVHFMSDTIESLKDIIRIKLNDLKKAYG